MGCVVNGPGEARNADLALICGKNRVFLYVAGVRTAVLDAGSAPRVVAEQVSAFCARKSG
jgi:4-hydroxy-3-methylbut-2-en-1-yl diphosphate synthase IspG/GcpE